jgi:NADH-quinone oxidoreductase subunit M
VLAALLLKVGGYAFIKINLTLFAWGVYQIQPYIIMCAFGGIIYVALMAVMQLYLKKIIAYASISHMSLAIIGLCSFTIYGLSGGIILMISHGLTSAGLFILIGVLYDRYHTRLISDYGGLAQVMPLFSTFFFFFL